MTDTQLEERLRETAEATRYPPTPYIAAGVSTALLHRHGGRRRRGMAWPAWGAVALATAAVLIAVTLTVAPAREAVARFFGVEGSNIEFIASPAESTLPAGDATPAPFPSQTGLGPHATPIPLEGIEAVTGFEPGLPAGRNGVALEEAQVLRYAAEVVVVLSYSEFDLWQARLGGFASFDKGLPEGVEARNTEVRGYDATWISGGEHFVGYTNATGTPVRESERLVERNTLIWRTDTLFYRMETDLPLAEALRIAETLP